MSERIVLPTVAEYRASFYRNERAFDYCEYQETVNHLGGDQFSPAYNDPPDVAGDNLKMYGFKFWMDYATFSPIKDEWEMPTFSGVYAVTAIQQGRYWGSPPVGALHILYIGSAKNIAARVETPGHWYQRVLERNELGGVAPLYVLPTTHYQLYERSLIRSLRPWFNIHHNGKKVH